MITRWVLGAALAAALALSACTPNNRNLEAAKPEAVGLSGPRLARLTDTLKADVDQGKIPGAVVLVARQGKLAYHEAIGFRDREAKAPMPKDAIFRIYSMTKPITSIAALMLIEEGKMSLGDPVSRWLPELAKREVASQAAGQANLERRAAKGEITVQDLLRHTSGFTYGVFGDTAVHKLYREGKVEEVDASNAEFVSRIAKMPLRNDPGTVWEYSRSTDVLGRLVEVVSGEKLSAFVARRITGPLGMKDTAFHVQPENLARLAEPQINPRNGKRDAMLDVTKPPVYEAGGQGMVSTAADYARFAQFLLNKGELDGVRLVSRKTIENMTANHLSGAVFRASGGEPIGPGYGFGLGVGVRMAGGIAPLPGSRGDFYWGGFGGTYFWVDPKEDLIAIYMMQDIAGRTHYRAVMRNLVYPALAD